MKNFSTFSNTNKKFLTLLENEQKQCESIPDKKLRDYLANLYGLKRTEYEKHLRLMVEFEYEKIANGLLQFEEEAHLMEYEIGLDMYQRVSGFHYTNDKNPETPPSEKNGVAVYPFQGEFWKNSEGSDDGLNRRRGRVQLCRN